MESQEGQEGQEGIADNKAAWFAVNLIALDESKIPQRNVYHSVWATQTRRDVHLRA
jgi:hypothetical protein